MMEKIADRLFWTLSAIIIAALCLTIGIKTFPKTTAVMMAYSLNQGNITQRGFGTGNMKTTYWLKPAENQTPLEVEDNSPKIRNLKNQIAKLQADAQNKDSSITALQKQINDANAKMNALTVSLNQATSDAINKNIDAHNQITAYQTSIAALTNQMNLQIQQAQTNANSYNAQITSLINQENALQDQYANVQKQTAGGQATAEQQAIMDSLNAQINSVKNQIDTTNQSMMDSGNQLSNQVNDIQADVQDMTNQHTQNLFTQGDMTRNINQITQDYYSVFPQTWDKLTIDQQNDFIQNGYDQLSDAIKVLWTPSHYRLLTQADQIDFANNHYNLLSQADQVYADQIRAKTADQYGLTATLNSDNTVTVTGHTGNLNSNLVIPPYISFNGKAYPVTEIGRAAFQAAPITTLVLPYTLKTIDDLAFYQTNYVPSYGLTTINFGTSLQHIGWNAFANTGSITGALNFPATLNYINDGAFSWTNPTSISLPKNTQFTPGLAFWGVNSTVLNSITYF